MTQSATRIANVKWNISVPPDFDEATRIYLASQGGKKGSLSSLVQKAVSRYILSSLTGEAKERCVHLGYPRMSSTRLLRMELPGLRTNRDESRS